MINVQFVHAGEVIDQGDCGKNAHYKITEDDGVCIATISGTGSTYDYEYGKSPLSSTQINQVIFEKGITKVGASFCSPCDELESVILPDGLEIIGINSFLCANISDIDIPQSVSCIKSGAFFACHLESVTIPGNVVYVEDGAFAFNGKLTDLRIESGVRRIEKTAFLDCGIESVELPNSVESIGDECFSQCVKLKEVKLSNKLRTIPPKAFYYCWELQGITIPKGVTEICEQAFSKCEKLDTVSLPKGLKKIGSLAFQDTKALKELLVPTTVTYISNDILGEHGVAKVIHRASVPTKIVSIIGEKKAVSINWAERTVANTGYQIQYSMNKKFKSSKKVEIADVNKNTKIITRLKSKKKYYIRIRTYHKEEGKTYYSRWSSYKAVKTK